MTFNPLATKICPWLGSEIDRTTRYGYPSTSNVCFSPQAPASLTTLHQEQWCLSGNYGGCLHFVDPPAGGLLIAPAAPTPDPTASRYGHLPTRWIALALGAVTVVIILLGLLIQFSGQPKKNSVIIVGTPSVLPVSETETEFSPATQTASATATSSPSPSPFWTRTPLPTPTHTRIASPQPTPTLTPLPGSPTAQALPYLAPTLVSPASGSTVVAGTQVELKWVSAGNLRSDEWYDVQIWKDSEPPHGIAWSKESYWTMPADYPPGKYRWRIVVIQGKDGKWAANLSPASETWSLDRQ